MNDNYYALIVGDQYDTHCFTTKASNIHMAIYNYYNYCGHSEDNIFYKLCLNDNIFTLQEIIAFFHVRCAKDEEIQEIYLLGEKVYG